MSVTEVNTEKRTSTVAISLIPTDFLREQVFWLIFTKYVDKVPSLKFHNAERNKLTKIAKCFHFSLSWVVLLVQERTTSWANIKGIRNLAKGTFQYFYALAFLLLLMGQNVKGTKNTPPSEITEPQREQTVAKVCANSWSVATESPRETEVINLIFF